MHSNKDRKTVESVCVVVGTVSGEEGSNVRFAEGSPHDGGRSRGQIFFLEIKNGFYFSSEDERRKKFD